MPPVPEYAVVQQADRRAEWPWGVALAPGQQALAAVTDGIVWYDRSPFIAASCGAALPGVIARPRRCDRPTGRSRPAPGRRRVAATFAPEHDVGEPPWERESEVPLLAADREVVTRAGDKIAAIGLCRSLGVRAPDAVVVPGHDDRSAPDICARLGSADLVVQRAPNNLIGRGTVRVGSAAELAAALAAWPGEPLKVARFQAGLPVTVSGCVGADTTVVSMVSQQLVGLDELAAGWGTHCGNQLLGPDDLTGSAYRSCRAVCHAIGEGLRGHGFRGAFGVDAVVDAGGRVWFIEVNPRFQTVVSLVQAAEVANGLLPMLGLHVLAHRTELGPLLYPGELVAPDRSAAQMVVHFPQPGQVGRLPESGCYRLGADGRLVHTADRHVLDLAGDEALVWAHAYPGDRVMAGDEAVLVQFNRRIATVAETPVLHDEARRWLAAVRAEVRLAAQATAATTGATW
jgi:hypothetical protein